MRPGDGVSEWLVWDNAMNGHRGSGLSQAEANEVAADLELQYDVHGLLAELRTPTSTSDLAARISITTGGASQHLTALRAAGLVSSHRTGHSVLHARTATAEAMIANGAATDEDPPSA